MAGAPSNPISQSSALLRFPEDLITDILLHLTVKSLMKFKCVSKSWLSLISSTQFIRSHFSTSSREGQYLNHQLLFITQPPTSGMKHCSLPCALYYNVSTPLSDIEYPSKNHEDYIRVVGIVNGLVCLDIGRTDLYVWNPALRKSKHLPSSKSGLRDGSWIVAYGFGYDESNDDYKVVQVSRFFSNEGFYGAEIMVYSLRTDSWRSIEDFKNGVLCYECDTGPHASGMLYFIANGISGLSQKKKIVSLDMTSEKYEEVDGPCDVLSGAYDWKIGVLNGRLYMLCDYYKEKADLWVRDKCDESWFKVVSVPYDAVHPAVPYFRKRVVCILGNDEIVLLDGSGLIVYHTKKREFRNIQLDNGFKSNDVFAYVESLVSPNDL